MIGDYTGSTGIIRRGRIWEPVASKKGQ